MSVFDSDIERALDLYHAVAGGGPDERLVYLSIPGAPPSKVRHRFGNGRAYTPDAQRSAEERTAWFLREKVKRPFTGNVALGCIFYRPNRQRIDTDNLLKHVCDSANGILWADDSQVTAIIGITEYDTTSPRTLIVVGNHVSTLTRGSDATYPCAVCSTPIAHIGQTKKRATCSKACATRARGYEPLDTPIPCPQCGAAFRRTTKEQQYCSTACGRAAFRGKRRGKAKPRSRCVDCDIELTHTRGGRCRACWMTSIKERTP